MTDPFDGVSWTGWARYGRQLGAVWHRVIAYSKDGERTVEPLCGQMPMSSSTVIMEPTFDPGVDVCPTCAPGQP